MMSQHQISKVSLLKGFIFNFCPLPVDIFYTAIKKEMLEVLPVLCDSLISDECLVTVCEQSFFFAFESVEGAFDAAYSVLQSFNVL